MFHYLRFFWILGFLIASSCGEKKINLDDIERDNLHSESKSSSGIKKASYSVNDENVVENQDYQLNVQFEGQNTEGLGSYGTTQSDNDQYQARGNQYAEGSKDIVRYQQETRDEPSQSIGQYPEEYSQQIELVANKGQPTAVYQPQQLYYEPEISVGNQYQAIQQKTATKKYVINKQKDTSVYIPMSQLLAYYPHLSLGQGSSGKREPLLHRLATQAAQQIPVSLYNSPSLNRPAVETYGTPSKQAYQIHPQYLIYPTKSSAQHVGTNYQTEKNQVYSQDAYRQPQEVLYTQAVFPPQSHNQGQTQQFHQHEIVYTQPNAGYSQVAAGHATAYATQPDYVHQEVQGQQEQYANYQQPDGYVQYVIATNPVYPAVQQNYEKNIPATPSEDFTPPQAPGHNYKSVNNNQYTVTSDSNHGLNYLQNHIGHSSEPKSLLDSYTPSFIIAAKDTARYQERPLKLEGGFLPSKINFIHSYKKRKSE